MYYKPEEIKHFKHEILYLPFVIIPEYVKEHWKEDDFYGCQFLNAVNPKVIKKCTKLLTNFSAEGNGGMEDKWLGMGNNLCFWSKLVCLKMYWYWNEKSLVSIALFYYVPVIALIVLPIKKGNIFLYDQKMDGTPARLYDGEPLLYSVLLEPKKQNDANCNTGITLTV